MNNVYSLASLSHWIKEKGATDCCHINNVSKNQAFLVKSRGLHCVFLFVFLSPLLRCRGTPHRKRLKSPRCTKNWKKPQRQTCSSKGGVRYVGAVGVATKRARRRRTLSCQGVFLPPALALLDKRVTLNLSQNDYGRRSSFQNRGPINHTKMERTGGRGPPGEPQAASPRCGLEQTTKDP